MFKCKTLHLLNDALKLWVYFALQVKVKCLYTWCIPIHFIIREVSIIKVNCNKEWCTPGIWSAIHSLVYNLLTKYPITSLHVHLLDIAIDYKNQLSWLPHCDTCTYHMTRTNILGKVFQHSTQYLFLFKP